MSALRPSAALLAFVPAAVVLACGAVNFDPQSKIGSVRVFATKADKPYAKPGDTVSLEVLAFDARPVRPEPLVVSWFPTPCVDPPGDAYFGCFAAAAKLFAPGQDMTPILLPGTTFSFQMPADALARHAGGRGNTPYGLAIAFTFACAGHVEYTPPDPGLGPNAVPFACFDANHTKLGPDDFVFAFSQVYSFTDRTNQNPVLDHVSFGGTPIDPAQGITLDHCTETSIGRCAATALDTVLADGSQEPDPGAAQPDGTIPGEQIWVDYYYTDGRIGPDALTLFDPKAGRLPSDTSTYRPPLTAGDQMIWAVVHDNRGGATWMSIPVHVR